MSKPVLVATRVVYGMLAVCFLWFASLQFNDVDAPYWIAVYAVAALSCVCVTLLITSALHRTLTALFIMLLLIWIVTLVPSIEGKWWDGEVERELGGLTIVLITQLGTIFFFRRMSRS